MKTAFRSTDLNDYGYSVSTGSKLLVIYFSKKADRTVHSGFEYPHISIYCTTLSEVSKAYGSEITAEFDKFHISFDDARKVWRLATCTADPASPALITDDTLKQSATLGVTAKRGDKILTVDNICNDFFLPILNKRTIIG